MRAKLFRASRFHLTPTPRAGVTLIEVLATIFILGLGLLALLTLFPLGALALAQTIKDDRAGKIATDAVAFGQDGLGLLSRTGDFISDSLSNGTADTQTAAELRLEYDALSNRAAELEARLRELRANQSDPKAQRRLDQLLAQIRALKAYLDSISKLLKLLEDGL